MKLYVGNLAWSLSDNDLMDQFTAFGEVRSASIVMDRDTNRSKGFGFVEMANATEAKAAIDALNGKDMGGRALVVNEARPRQERPSGDRPGADRPRRPRF